MSTITTVVINTEKDQKGENNLDKGTSSAGSKGSDKVASGMNTDLHNLYDGINVQVSGLVDGIVRKKPGTVSNSKTVHQHNKTTLRSRKKCQGNLTGGKAMFSRSSKRRTACFGEGK